YLGGFSYDAKGQWRERPVTIVDAGLRKNLDLQVISPVEHFGPLPEKSIWPAIYRRLAEEVRRHRSTIIFVNNRRTVERLTAMLNECLWEGEAPAEQPPFAETNSAGPMPSRTFPSGTAPTEEILVRAHHGSVALEVRQQTE